MNTTTEIDFEEYRRLTGKRFRISTGQKSRGLTREEALRERLANNDIKELVKRQVPESAWSDPDLTLENFQEKTGVRFRMSPSQVSRGLSREQAFQETLQSKRTENNA